jgi:hypothetical protein
MKYEENILSHSKQTLANYTAFGVALAFASMLTAFAAHANPATDHPRLWLNSSDLPRLRSWATSANPMYKDGLLVAANAAKAYADARWNYAIQMPSSGWRDTGSTSWEGDNTEAYAEFFAFMSLIDPDPAARPQWAQRARAADVDDEPGGKRCQSGAAVSGSWLHDP